MAIAAAAAAAMHPSSPPPLARRCVASLSLACTHLALAASDTVVCLFLASTWLLYWDQATKTIGRLACGEGCAVVTAADKVVSVAFLTLVLIFAFVVLLAVLLMLVRTKVAAAAATENEETSHAAVRDMLCGSLALGVLASMAFVLLMLIGVLVMGDSPVMGSRRERIGLVIYAVGELGTAMVNCFVSGPIMTVRVWRDWGKARAWIKAQHARYAVETKP